MSQLKPKPLPKPSANKGMSLEKLPKPPKYSENEVESKKEYDPSSPNRSVVLQYLQEKEFEANDKAKQEAYANSFKFYVTGLPILVHLGAAQLQAVEDLVKKKGPNTSIFDVVDSAMEAVLVHMLHFPDSVVAGLVEVLLDQKIRAKKHESKQKEIDRQRNKDINLRRRENLKHIR